MDRDMSSLALLRQRYENFVHHPSVVDKKMRDILLIPPLASSESKVKIEEVREEDIHTRNTRLIEERLEAF